MDDTVDVGTEQHVAGAFGETLTLNGHTVMLRPTTVPPDNACWASLPGTLPFEMVITAPAPFVHEFWGVGGFYGECYEAADGYAPVGGIRRVFLPVTPGAPISIAISPNHVAQHLFVFDFH